MPGNKPGSGQLQVFVGHEFSNAKIDDFRGSVDEALADSGLNLYYADQQLVAGKQIFVDKIVPVIDRAAFGIYDISEPANANVLLELGAGLALQEICVIVCSAGTKVPSNLQGLDRIEYQSFRELTIELRKKTKQFWPS